MPAFPLCMTTPTILSLAGQAALVTGAATGIGSAAAQRLAAAGAAVAVNHLPDQQVEANGLVESIIAAGGRAIAIAADVTREADTAAMLRRAIEQFGALDILVANAGVQRDAPAAEMSLEDWQTVMGVNLTGAFLSAREAVRHFLARPHDLQRCPARGKIICITSVHQHIPWSGHVNYAASKGGLRLMVESLAQELAEHKIRVNAVAPGAIRTGINRQAWSTEEASRKLLRLIPYGRIGEPDDVAEAVLWLASDASDYVTGATIVVDGGMSLYPGFRGNG
jgi:glucose 1-dehydrogenase